MTLGRLRNFSDIIHGTIPYNGFEEILLKSPLLLRLQRVSQSSLVFVTFPSNKTKRFEHSIGTMHLISNMFQSAVSNSETSTVQELLTKVKDELINQYEVADQRDSRFAGQRYPEKFYGDDTRKGHTFRNISKICFKDSSFFNRITPANVDKDLRGIYIALLQGLRIAGLVHDIGHLPYSHTLEATLSEVYAFVAGKTDKMLLEEVFCNAFEKYAHADARAESRQVHEVLSERIFKILAKRTATELCKQWENEGRNGTQPRDRASDEYCVLSYWAFIVAYMVQYESNTFIYKLFHQMISGVIDADRLDYASRDLVSSAVSSDIINYNRLFLNLAFRKDGDTILLSALAKSIHDIEEFLRKRWRIYRDINFHHSVHKSELIMRKLLKNNTQNSFATTSDIPDFNTNTLPDDFIIGILIILNQLNNNGDNDALEKLVLRLDDSWLDTLLKRNSEETEESVHSYTRNESALVDEIVEGRSAYRSDIKRFSDYIDFDEMVFENCMKKVSEWGETDVINILSGINAYYEFFANHPPDPYIENETLYKYIGAADQFFDDLSRNAFSRNSEMFDEQSAYEILSATDYVRTFRILFSKDALMAANALSALQKHSGACSEDFWTLLQEKLKIYTSDHGFNDDDILIGEVDFSTGLPIDEYKNIDQTLVVWKTRKREHVKFSDYSVLGVELQIEKGLLPPFHLYTRESAVTDIEGIKEILAGIFSDLLMAPFQQIRITNEKDLKETEE